MKQLLLFPLLLTAMAFAQHWRPVPANGEWFHYSADTAGYPTHLLAVDSVTLTGNDTVYHLLPNAFSSLSPTEWGFSVAGNTATAAVGGNVWTLAYGNHLVVLHTLAQPGAQWISGNDSATVVSVDTMTIFGQTDSIKRIVIGNDSVLLTKEYGIFHISALANEPGFTLTGVDHGRVAGEQVPDVFDYFDFAPGDTFCRKATSSYFDGFIRNWSGWLKRTAIQTKTVINDTLIEYIADVATVAIWGYNNYSNGSEVIHTTDTLRISPHSSQVVAVAGMQGEFRPNTMYGIFGVGNVNRIVHDAAGHIEFSFQPGFFANPDQNWTYVNAYAVGLGQIVFDQLEFETQHSERLLGWSKAGKSWGVIPNDSVLLLMGIDASSAAFTLAPNPANTHVVLTLTDDARPGTAALLDLQGREIRQTAVAGGTAQLETADLPAGLYLLRVQTETGAATQKVMIQH